MSATPKVFIETKMHKSKARRRDGRKKRSGVGSGPCGVAFDGASIKFAKTGSLSSQQRHASLVSSKHFMKSDRTCPSGSKGFACIYTWAKEDAAVQMRPRTGCTLLQAATLYLIHALSS